VVFDSASPEFFSAHVDMTQVPALAREVHRLEPDAGLGALYRRISTLEQVTIASIAGRVRGAGSEFVLACDLRFASLARTVRPAGGRRRRRARFGGGTTPHPPSRPRTGSRGASRGR
jgi:enoyl-CoA hydratase/carnithine racemase